MHVKGLAFVLYPVSDLDRAIEFYGGAFGFEPGQRFGDIYAEFVLPDGAAFGVCKLRDDKKSDPDFPMNVGEPGSGKTLAIEVDDLKATISELRDRGLDPGPVVESPICSSATLRDPDGNRVILHRHRDRTA